MSDSFHLKTEVNSPDPKKWKILAYYRKTPSCLSKSLFLKIINEKLSKTTFGTKDKRLKKRITKIQGISQEIY